MKNTHTDAIVQNILQKIEQHLANKIRLSVDNIESLSGYSKRHLQKIFKKHTGMTLSQYIRGRILSHAALLLTLTDKSIFHIATELNFATQQSFSRAFFQRFSSTPSDYRKRKTFNCQELLPNYTLTRPPIPLIKKHLPAMKIKAREVRYRDTILGQPIRQRYTSKFNAIKSVLQTAGEAIVVSCIEISDTNHRGVPVRAMVGNISTHALNYQTEENEYWELRYTGTWDDYLIFYRTSIFHMNFRISDHSIEIFRLTSQIVQGDDVFDVRIYHPVFKSPC